MALNDDRAVEHDPEAGNGVATGQSVRTTGTGDPARG